MNLAELTAQVPAATGQDLMSDLTTWRANIATGIREAKHYTKKDLQAAIQRVTMAGLAIAKTAHWNLDDDLQEMFRQNHGTIAKWISALSPATKATDAESYAKWWVKAQSNILGETDELLAKKPDVGNADVVKGIRAMLAESIAASLMAIPGTDQPWQVVLKPET